MDTQNIVKEEFYFAAAVVVKNFPTTQRSNYLEMLRQKMKEQASPKVQFNDWCWLAFLKFTRKLKYFDFDTGERGDGRRRNYDCRR